MKISSYSNRIGGFASANTGVIKDCFSDAKVKHNSNVAGFVYENSGEIHTSLVQKRTKGKENFGCFYVKNKGTISNSGFLRFKEKEKSIDEKYIDQEMIFDYEEPQDIAEKLQLGSSFLIPKKKKDRIELDTALYSLGEEIEGREAIEIDSADKLFEISEAIANGDSDAAGAYYKLTKNINLHGKEWLPLGISEVMPFRGVFDGCGFQITNFKIRAKDFAFAGFFGYAKGAKVVNLTLDCVVNAKNGTTVGGMCAVNDGGIFINCHVLAKVTAEKICGGFVGKNTGLIERCSFTGKVAKAIPILLWLLPLLGLLLILLIIGIILLIGRWSKSPYVPEVIDPNQRPVVDFGTYDPPPAGSERISIEMNQEAYFNVATQVGLIDFVNPKRGTKNLVIRIQISDAELLRTIGKTGRLPEDQAKLEATENYDPETTYQELFRSGLLEIGYALDAAKIGALPDGTTLPLGDYDMLVVVDAYDPETHEKSVMKTQLPIVVHMVESVERVDPADTTN